MKKLFKIQFSFLLIAILLIGCVDEVANSKGSTKLLVDNSITSPENSGSEEVSIKEMGSSDTGGF